MSVKLFNNLYTQTAFFGPSWKRTSTPVRSTYFTGILESLYGITPRVNIGVDAFVKSVYIDPEQESPLQIFGFPGGPNARTALTHAGPKIKFAPSAQWESLSIQSALMVPLSLQLAGHVQAPYLAFDGYLWWNRLFWENTYDNGLQIFLETALITHLDRDMTMPNSYVSAGQKAFLKYFATDRLTFYVMADVVPTFGTAPFISSFYTQEGVGTQYQLADFLEVELLYTYFAAGVNAGAGQTFNLGVRYLR